MKNLFSKKNETYISWKRKLAFVTLFFVPIKYDENYSSTLFQKTWKFFLDESNTEK